MKFPRSLLAKKVFAAIKDITHEGEKVAAYEESCQGKYPCIVIGSFGDVEDRLQKSSQGHDITQIVEIHSTYKADEADAITDKVLEILIPKDRTEYLDLSPNFTVWDVSLSSLTSLTEIQAPAKIIRNIVRIRFRAVEN